MSKPLVIMVGADKGGVGKTTVHRPASTMRFLPMALTRRITFSSSQVFMEVRSVISAPGKASDRKSVV